MIEVLKLNNGVQQNVNKNVYILKIGYPEAIML